MRRRAFDTTHPIREIRMEDTKLRFHSSLLGLFGLDLSAMYRQNVDDKHIWVYDARRDIAGVMGFVDCSSSIYLDLVSNNFALPRDLLDRLRPGAHLYRALEAAARYAGVLEITLDSVPERVGYWQRRGFVRSGPSHRGDFCALYPMEKRL